MKITNVPLLLGAIADVHDSYVDAVEGATTKPAPSGPAQLAAIVRTVLDLHQHRLWKRRDSDNKPGIAFVVTDDLAAAESAECRVCGDIDPELFWCRHVRLMFAALCDVEGHAVEAGDWPDLTAAIHTARRSFERPIANAIVRSITNPTHSSASRIELANAVLCSTPSAGEN